MTAMPAKPATLTKRLFGGLSIILGAVLLTACSGAYLTVDDSPLVTTPDRSVGLTPVTQAPSSLASSAPSPPSPSSADAGASLEAGTRDASVDGSPASALDAAPMGCVEPEPNGDPSTAPQLPLSFTCGRLSDDRDVDYFQRTTAPGDRTLRIVAPAGAAGDSLVVTATLQGGTSCSLGRNDILVLASGARYLFQVRSLTNTPTAYGILVER